MFRWFNNFCWLVSEYFISWRCGMANILIYSVNSSDPATCVLHKATKIKCCLFLQESPVIATYSLKFSIKIAAKPLQMETGLLLTAYRKSPTPYPIVQSPTLYDLPFCHNTARLAYYSTLWLSEFIQGQWFSCHLKANVQLFISNQ